MQKQQITLNFADIDKAVDAFEWVCKEYMKQFTHQGVDTYPVLRQKEDYCIWMELIPDPAPPRHVVYDADGYRDLVPWAKIKFEAPPMSGKQTVTLCTRPLEGSDPTRSWLRTAEEIFESFRAYMQEAGYLDQQPQEPMPSEDSDAVGEQLTPAEDEVGKKHGPTVKTQIRAKVFKQLKDEHPEWSQAKVAIEACDKLGEYVTADTVRNAYRAMGWEWKRADRIR